jgi:tetratricopeptide (TPR) repeat protein
LFKGFSKRSKIRWFSFNIAFSFVSCFSNNFFYKYPSFQWSNYSFSKIIYFLKQGLIEYPNDDSIFQQMLIFQAQNYFDKRQFDLAINIYKKIMKRYPKNMLCVQNIGICYFNLGQYEQALKYLEKTVGIPNLEPGKSEKLIALCKKYN